MPVNMSSFFGEYLPLSGGTLTGTLTLGAAVAGGDQAFTNVGDMTFAAGSILASGGTNGNTLLLRANDTTFITFTTGATDVCTLANITMSGTWLGTATLPALTISDTMTFATALVTCIILPNDGQINVKDNGGVQKGALVMDSNNNMSLFKDVTEGTLTIGGAGLVTVLFPSVAASAGATLKNSQILQINARYWNGSASTAFDYTIQNIAVATTPQATARHYINSVLVLSLDNTNGTVSILSAGSVDITSGVYKRGGTQVVGAQGAAVADASGGATIDAEARTALNALLARVRTHGLIAT